MNQEKKRELSLFERAKLCANKNDFFKHKHLVRSEIAIEH